MSIGRSFTTTSGPTSMSNSNIASFVVLETFIYNSLNTIFFLLNSIFCNCFIDFILFSFTECNNTRTIIPSVLQKFNSFCDDLLNVIVKRYNTNNAAALRFILRIYIREGKAKCQRTSSEEGFRVE
jgi:hypothetical protein